MIAIAASKITIVVSIISCVITIVAVCRVQHQWLFNVYNRPWGCLVGR